MNDAEMKAFWTDYWASGVKTSFKNDFSENYKGPLLENWSSYFMSRASHLKVLDLGCGNGALSELWFQHCKKNNLFSEIIGVDLADLNAAELSSDGVNIRYLGDTDFTMLPFENNTFDLIISMFGFEYGDRNASLQSVQRVLKDKSGAFRFVSHFYGSAIVKKNIALLALHRDIQSRHELLNLLKALCAEIGAVGNSSLAVIMREKAVSVAFSEFRTALQPLYDEYGADVESSSFFDLFRYLLGEGLNLDLENKLEIIESFKVGLVKDSGRLESLSTAAFSSTEMPGLKTLFQANGLYLEEPEILQEADGTPLGVILTGTKI